MLIVIQSRHASAGTGLANPRIDYKDISENVEYKITNAANRKAPISSEGIQSVVRAYSDHKHISAELNAKRNARSIIGQKIRTIKNPTERVEVLAEAAKLKQEVAELEAQLGNLDAELLHVSSIIPNDTHPDVPLGPESAAVTISAHGPEPVPASPLRDHVTTCKKLGLLDLESGALVTGSSWYYLLNEAALLELALTNYAISIAFSHGFTFVIPPDVIRSDIASRCGFQPRDHSDPPVSQMYHIAPHSIGVPSPELVLSGTAEIPLGGMFANKVLSANDLPKRVVGVGRAFRAEAGARGADTRGLYRVHQFTKVELFAVTRDGESEEMMKELLQVQKEILFGLELPIRVLDMPTEELGASAYRKYDIEAWMPGRGKWGEVSSLSNCTDYQARRLHIRYRPQPTPGSTLSQHSTLPFAHTLNGTAAAIPRLIVALLENGVIFDKNDEVIGIRLPAALKPFWTAPQNGRSIIQWSS
ncbi:hypothetical protein AX16_000452 [Volvariella volvacea WC 439]|nr:hypothetical protein AX16_000452 [Volvariella volvacea WC 439]